MSSGGGTAVATAAQSAAPAMTAPKPRRRAPTENWDDDFEFSLPKPKPKPTATPKRGGLGDRSNVPAPRESPDSFDEDWDDMLAASAGPSRSASLLSNASSASGRPASRNAAPAHLHPPRSSQSLSPTLPSPSTPSANRSSAQALRVAIADTAPIRGVVKRSSTSTVTPSGSGDLSLHETSPAHRSSPGLAQNSQMTVPGRHTDRQSVQAAERASSPIKRRPPGNMLQELPSPPSVDQLAESPRRNGFWKRFSTGPVPKPQSPGPDGRRRSSSVTGLAPANSVEPPVPPLPANLRSPSAGSEWSSSSLNSSSASLTNPAGPVKRLSHMMRRSSSNLSALSVVSAKQDMPPLPTAPRPYMNGSGSVSSIDTRSLNVPSRVQNGSPIRSPPLFSATPPRRLSPIKAPFGDPAAAPRAFSPGFHLPSPAPGSPYRQQFGDVHGAPAGSDTETEDKTPGRRRVRPASAQPPPQETDDANVHWSDTNSRVPSSNPKGPKRPAALPLLSANGSESSSFPVPSPAGTTFSHRSGASQAGSVGFAASTQTTLKRITSFSKKHGRRLSGGWKFGSASSGSSAETKPDALAAVQPPLETVKGSPSKAMEPTAVDILLPTVKRLTKQSAPPTKTRQSVDVVRTAKNRRRSSFNDLIIPDNVLAQQKELKRGIGAVKKFAGGVQALKGLVESHERVCDYILESGSRSETQLFASLESDYAQWWEMATVLIEVGSTSTDSDGPCDKSRRITLATEDARAATEALRAMSGASTSSANTFETSEPSSSDHDVFGNGIVRDSPKSERRAGRNDLSKRQLEVLRTMLRTPVEASDTVVQAVDLAQQMAPPNMAAKHNILPTAPLSLARTTSPEQFSYIFPTSSIPSPETAGHLAQPRSRSGLAGLRDFLRGLKKQPTEPKAPRRRPPPIDLEATRNPKYTTPPLSPLPSADTMDYRTQQSANGDGGSPTKADIKRRRPSLKAIFRPSSGNWSELVRRTPPASPLVPTTPGIRHSASRSSLRHDGSGSPAPTPRRGTLARPPSVPALARLKSKTGSYAALGVDSAASSPTRPGFRHRPSVGSVDAPPVPPMPSLPHSKSQPLLGIPPQTPPRLVQQDSDSTLRLKSRILGLGHPSENSPSRTSSSPARASVPPVVNDLAVPDETPRSRSDGAAVRAEETVALTPENLPVLLDYVRQCELRLNEWKQRAGGLGLAQ